MGKLQHFEMRAEELSNLYPADFTKKEAQKTGVQLVTDTLGKGEIDAMQFTVNLARLNEVVSSAMEEMRKHIPHEKQTYMGVEFTPVLGGDTPNFKDDEFFLDLQSQMEHRKSLLKVALNSDIDFYDDHGVKVPKVSTTPRKSSITIKF